MTASRFLSAETGVHGETARRLRLLARLGFIWAALIVARLFYLQIVQHDDYTRQAQQQQEKLVKVQPPRGTILDRGGLPLAMSLPVDSVFVNPLLLRDRGMSAAILAPILSLDAKELQGRLDEAASARRGFLWVKRKITPQESERLRGLKLEWIGLTAESRRYYPYDSLAAHVLGSVDPEDQGLGGLEYKLNDELAGAPGYLRVATDVHQHGFASEPEGAAAVPGRNLHLTIDSRIQYLAEQALKDAVVGHHCVNGSIVAMDPRTGEILALANYPAFDPNQTPKSEDDRTARLNLAVGIPFEPGSVFKVVTLTAALETTSLRPESIINCGNGSITLFGRVIHDDVHDHYASLSMADVLAHSSNIGAINIGLKVGKENLYNYIRKFGFGSRTSLPLPGESSGVVYPTRRWGATSIASMSMGHELSVTVIQLAQACSIIANGGFLVKPRLLMDAPRVPPLQVIRPETAILMRQMMEGVVLRGTGKGFARLDGYTSAGKTGTAQIVDPETHKYTHFHNASFMGFAPVTNPRIVVVVSAHGASGLSGYGREVAAPAFARVAAGALRLLEVPQDLPDAAPIPDNGNTGEEDLAIADLGSPVPELLTSIAEGPKIPDFTGWTTRRVVEEASSLGIPVEFIGAGVARAQAPAAGAILRDGESVKVRFGR